MDNVDARESAQKSGIERVVESPPNQVQSWKDFDREVAITLSAAVLAEGDETRRRDSGKSTGQPQRISLAAAELPVFAEQDGINHGDSR
jgi:hypothetical protein